MNKLENKKDNLSEEEQLQKLASFENRWKYAVIPAMVAFFMLSGFGFYLIFGMLERMTALSKDIHLMTRVMSESLPVMQGGVVSMSSRMQSVGNDLEKMTKDVNAMSAVLNKVMPSLDSRIVEMAANINRMSYSTAAMATTTDNMGRNIWDMNRNISKPMSFFGDMMPWQRSTATPPPSMMTPTYQHYIYPSQQITTPAAMTSASVGHTQSLPVNTGEKFVGKSKYDGYCASCHGAFAEGGVGPSLIDSTTDTISDVLHSYKDGKLEGTMTGVVKTLSNDDIANIARFIGEELETIQR
ncbi:MAG: c-type cytochrome [Gammaproteobacteria bacterium]|nr:c-type cytochrome [Gammaproteobacteria bacterium]